MPEIPVRSHDLTFAVALRCGPGGCDLEPLAGGAEFHAAYSDAVRGTVKIRPGDLVAVEPAGPTIVWRWWSGTIESVDASGDRVAVSRNITQSGPNDPRRWTMDVVLPDELVGGVDIGGTVWFGNVDGHMVAVAVAGPEAQARLPARLPAVPEAIDGPSPL